METSSCLNDADNVLCDLLNKILGYKKTLIINTCTFTLSKVPLLMINIFPKKVYDIPKANLQFES